MMQLGIPVMGAFMLLGTTAAQFVCDKPSHPSPWEHVGPGGYVGMEDSAQVASAGAAQAAVRLDNLTSWLVATTNGGIWKTSDLLAETPGPHWSQVLDGQKVSCTSISAMESKGRTVLAGCGAATSSEMGWDWNVANTGDWGGVMISQDGGGSWSMTAFPPNYFVTAFVVHSSTSFVAAARSHFYDRDDGGVWVTVDAGKSWNRTLARPVYDLIAEPSSGLLLAALPWAADGSTVLASRSGGLLPDWRPASSGIHWDGRVPFYPTFALGQATVFIGALTVNPARLADTASAIYFRPIRALLAAMGEAEVEDTPGVGLGWQRVPGGPARLDRDGMPKDRMALLVHPRDEETLFVAGNADALVWRVAWRTGAWVVSAGRNDTRDGSAPHADCRRYFWEPTSGSLLLLSDGGAFLREQPDSPGGRWRSLAGDTAAMEFLSADWDPIGRRWVGGAQDNSIQVAPTNTSSTSQALGVINGDGSVTAVDTVASPPRLWGATQNLGNIVDDDGPTKRRRRGRGSKVEDDGTDCSGFGFYQGGLYTCVPLLKWFSVSQFFYFVQPFALLANDPTQALLFAGPKNTEGEKAPGGIYRLQVPYSVKRPDDIAAPTLEVHADGVQVIVAGGVTGGRPDPAVLVAINATALLHRSSRSGGKLVARRLPQAYAEPVVFEYPTSDTFVLGPCSHSRTVSLAVSPANSDLIALSGWESVVGNLAAEKVWVSADAGASFRDVTGNLREATGTVGQVRVSALSLLPLLSLSNETTALLAGTVAGVFVSFLEASPQPASVSWTRLGGCEALPLVLVAGLSYQKVSDTLVAATFGRGVYVVHEVSRILGALHMRRKAPTRPRGETYLI